MVSSSDASTAATDRHRALVAWLRASAFSRRSGAPAWQSVPLLAFVAMSLLVVILFKITPLYAQNSGMGDDGMNYSAWARDWNGALAGLPALGLNSYSAQRVFPMILVRELMDLLRMPLLNTGILRVFEVLDAVCVVGALGFVTLAARHMRLSRAGFLVVLIGSFFNYSALYWLPFDPVLTDSMGVLVGAASLWAYLSRRYAALAVISVIGGFVWPSAAQCGMVLLFFPRPRAGEEDSAARPDDPALDDAPSALDTGIAALLAAAIGTASFHFAAVPQLWKEHALHPSLLRLSCGLLTVYAFAGFRALVRVKATLRQLLRFDASSLYSRGLAVVVWLVVGSLTKWIAQAPTKRLPQAPPIGMSDVFQGLMVRAVTRPLGFLWAHGGFFGPLVLLLFVFWPRVSAASRRLGFGLDAILALTLFFSFNSESRGMIALAPLVLPLVAVACARLPWTPSRLFQLALITLGASKLWFSAVQAPSVDWETIFAHIGPWMSNDAMFLHALACGLIVVWLLVLRRSTPPPDETVWLCEAQP